MNQETRIEYYLAQLDAQLRVLPIGQRAEVITEIKAQIENNLAKDPALSLPQVLEKLGTPAQVASRILNARGLVSNSPPRRRRLLKWLAVGTVAFFGFVFVGGLLVIWSFSPILKIDKTQGHVMLFGGLIDINEKLGHIKMGDLEINEALREDGLESSGEEDLGGRVIRLIKIPFNTAKLDVHTTAGSNVKWTCRSMGGASPKTSLEAGTLHFNLDALNLAKCTIGLPAGMAAEFQGVNGHMDVDSPSDMMKISLVNGKVNIRLDPERVYDVDVKVKNGLSDFFPRSNNRQAVRVKVDVVNGLVKKE